MADSVPALVAVLVRAAVTAQAGDLRGPVHIAHLRAPLRTRAQVQVVVALALAARVRPAAMRHRAAVFLAPHRAVALPLQLQLVPTHDPMADAMWATMVAVWVAE